MSFEKRKAPKVKVKRKDDEIEKIDMKKSVAPSKKEKSRPNAKQKSKPTKAKTKTKVDNGESTFKLLKGGASRKHRKKRNSIISLSFISMLIVAVIVIQIITPTGIVEWSQNGFFMFGSGGGLPVAVSGDSVRDMQTRGGSAFLMTDSHMYAFSSNGKQITSIQHGYSAPVMCVSAARTLIYDRGSFGLRVDALYANIVDTQLKEEILTADICDKGYVAVASQSADYTAFVNVYDKDFKNIFRWSSPDGYVSCIELSDNGKYMAVCTVTGKNGDYCSNINVFRLSNGERIFNKQVLGSMYVSATSNRKFITFAGTDSVVSYGWDGSNETNYEYYNLQLVNMDYNDYTALIHHPGGDERRYTVSIIGKEGKEVSTFSVDGLVSKACVDKKYFYAYYNGKVQRYLHDGSLDNEFSVGYEYVFIAPYKNKLAIVSDMKLDTLK